MQDIFRKSGDHTKETKNSHMKMGSGTRGASHEHNEGLGGFQVELVDALESVFVVKM